MSPHKIIKVATWLSLFFMKFSSTNGTLQVSVITFALASWYFGISSTDLGSGFSFLLLTGAVTSSLGLEPRPLPAPCDCNLLEPSVKTQVI